MMNKYLKSFLHRGLAFGGFGPIVVGIVDLILSKALEDFSLNGVQIFTAIVSSYFLAFIQAGASVFNQIEHWSVVKSVFCHFSLLYVAYTACYLINSWIPFEPKVLLIFSLIFATGFFVIWAAVYLSVKATSKKFNSKLNR